MQYANELCMLIIMQMKKRILLLLLLLLLLLFAVICFCCCCCCCCCLLSTLRSTKTTLQVTSSAGNVVAANVAPWPFQPPETIGRNDLLEALRSGKLEDIFLRFGILELSESKHICLSQMVI